MITVYISLHYILLILQIYNECLQLSAMVQIFESGERLNVLHVFNHLRSPRLLCVRSLGSPWYDYVYFNSASSSIQWVVSLLQ